MRSLQKRSHALSLSGRVGLALGLLAALMLGVLLATWVVLRVKRGPGVTLRTLFNRQPIPARRPESDPSDPEAAKSLDDLSRQDSLPQHPSPRRLSNVSPRRLSQRTSQHEYMSLHEKTTNSPTTTIRTTPAADHFQSSTNPGSSMIPLRPIARLGPVRTMSEADIRRVPPPSPLRHAAAAVAGLRTSTRSAGTGTGTGMGTAPQAIHPPAWNLPWKDEEFYVPDSPEDHIIVLPSPRDLKTFRLTLHA
ncbi:uncharacterized protein BO72DRAFT_457148 [Aspergillus fijiensis CBS 313.89]|uniref:Uncharacterized protein n=1 Tax=Aspergillus fijiensis CBS 313.89 TaxID=1448319 RepID=A0A8G1W0M2_9EURO|nr:uncharacterized protein BO72DRAFT_457148 [Aspergillus fijiensis CBS 313.89]RAK79502.1 hypothetical protein BO72DRAFT_457148 [Aspergillus fijiensis CBS 313.89]